MRPTPFSSLVSRSASAAGAGLLLRPRTAFAAAASSPLGGGAFGVSSAGGFPFAFAPPPNDSVAAATTRPCSSRPPRFFASMASASASASASSSGGGPPSRRSLHSTRILSLGKHLPDDAYTGIEIRAGLGDRELEGTNVERALEALANADAVCFDVDSTVIMEEGIDVLADYLGKGDEVAAWTRKAMEGDTKFEDALAARLDILRPSRSDIENCLRDRPLRLSPGVDVLIERLNERGVDVYLVSGGFRLMIEPLARELCVSRTNIVANTVLFDDDTGEYRGFCSEEPTSRDMGKPAAIRRLKEQHGYGLVVMVGDGATDLQAVPPADAFVGFGGVAVRESVREKACWFVTDFRDAIEVVERFGRRKVGMGP